MSELFDRLNNLSSKRLALLVMDLQAKLEAAERQRAEPIAIIGMALRFPRANDPDAFWRLLVDGVDAIDEIPGDRFDVEALFDPDPEAPGKIATRWGGFLNEVDRFDADVFGIAPREAAGMDPQQRLLLESAWEALERAGYAPDRLRGSQVGVFAGLCNGDYGQMLLSGDRRLVDAYTATGSAHSVAAGRISYVLGLQGPSIAVDTACSSSLVAAHLAVQSLRNGECRMAIAGGSNVILSAETTITLSRARMMAPDGRCKAFDASADGFVRSEGCGVVVLKRLTDAVADHDPVLAVIRGSSVNQDGRSNGLTAPNGPAQEAVLRAALADAGLPPSAVSYVEAHGTGTSLGDPIEARALGAVLGERGDAGPLLVGSVKSNLGHLEAAAGMAGLIKVVLMLGQGQVPPSLHFQTPSPHIPWESLPLRIPTKAEEWPAGAARVAGVSSFGFSGTNAHLILEAPPEVERPVSSLERPVHLIKLSAMNADAIREQAERYVDALSAAHEPELADFAHTANVARGDLPHRAAVVVGDRAEAHEAFASLLNGDDVEGVLTGTSGPRSPKVAFLFTGQGSQYPGMGKHLYATSPVFRDALDQCAELLVPYLDRPLLDLIFAESDTPEADLLDQTHYTQPALFAMEYALARLWQSWGIQPTAVAGHSLGEFVAACIAGVLSLEDALRVVSARGRLMGSLPAGGAMAAVFATEAQVAEVLGDLAVSVPVAAVNGPASVTLSGDESQIEAAVEQLQGAGLEARVLRIPLAAHSPKVEPILDVFEAEAASVSHHAPQIDFISGLTGRRIEASEFSARYWRQQLRQPVRFAESMQTLLDGGHTVFIEMGPHPTLIGMARHFLPDGSLGIPSLRRGQDEWRTLLESLGALYVSGCRVDWIALDAPYALRRVVLPTYPFQRERYWHPALDRPRSGNRALQGGPPSLLGRPVLSPALDGAVFETYLGPDGPEFLFDHRIHGHVVLPSPAYLEMIRSAVATNLDTTRAITNFQIHEALVISENNERVVQTVLASGDAGTEVRIFSRRDDEERWRLHAEARVEAGLPDGSVDTQISIDEVRERCAEGLDADLYYARLADLGLEFGSSFRGLRQVHRRDGEALGRMELPEALANGAREFAIHPALLDSCFHLLGAALDADHQERTYLLIGIDRFRIHHRPGRSFWNHVRLHQNTAGGTETFGADVRLYDDDGRQLVEVLGIQMKLARPEAIAQTLRDDDDDLLYDITWMPAPGIATAVDVGKIGQVVTGLLPALAIDHGLGVYDELLPALDDLGARFAARALGEFGWSGVSGSPADVADLSARLDLRGSNYPLLRRLVAMSGGAASGHADEHKDPEAWAAELLERYPDAAAEIGLTARCGPALANVLRGEEDPLQLLFPDGSLEPLEQLYRHSPFARVYNGLIKEAVARIVAQLPVDRPLRVLEVGAGTGATTSAVLEVLPVDRTEYWFTDVSDHFLERARGRLSGTHGLRFQLFDVERTPAEQGLESGMFDIVIAANVLHATADIRRSLKNIRGVLAPGGHFLMLEGTRPRNWVDITFGLTEGWWRFQDSDLRSEHPLLGRDEWTAILLETGFGQSAIVGFPEQHPIDQVLILAAAPSRTVTETREWILLPDASGMSDAVRARLLDRGELVTVLSSTDELPGLLASRSDSSRPLRVLAFNGLDLQFEDAGAKRQLEMATKECAGSIDVIRWVAASSTLAEVWMLTRGAQPVHGPVVAPAQATLWGLGRVMGLEYPEQWGGLIDLDPLATPADSADQVLMVLDTADAEDQVALRNGGGYLARLTPAQMPASAPISLHADASYLLVGGTGGIGLKLARWFAEQGARHLVITSRSPLPPRAEWGQIQTGRQATQIRAIEDIERLGVDVEVVCADVADREQMQAVFARFGAGLPPLRGIVHAAAHLGPYLLSDLPADELQSMLRPKVAGSLLLHELSDGLELDFFVLFSSTTALWGSAQLGHYAAANTFLDAFAHWRQHQGLPALSINWGTWDEMRVASDAARDLVAGFGLNPLPSDRALDTMGRLLGSSTAQMAVADVDWGKLKPAYEARRARPLLALVGGQRDSEAPEVEPPRESEVPSLLVQLEKARVDERRDLVSAFVRSEVSRTLGTRTGVTIDPQQGLFQLGMDSLMAVDLKARLEKGIGHGLPSTVVFNHPTIDALSDFLLADLVGNVLPEQTADTPDEPVQRQPEVTGDFDQMSEDELERLLVEKLSRMHGPGVGSISTVGDGM